MGTCSLRLPGPRSDPIRPPAATFWKTKHTNQPTTNNPAYLEISPVPYFPSLFPVLTKSSLSLSLSLTILSRTALLSEASSQSLSSQSKYSAEGISIFYRVRTIPYPCLSQTTKYGSSVNITIRLYKHLLHRFLFKKKKKKLSVKTSSFLSAKYWPQLTPFSSFCTQDGRREEAGTLSLRYMPHLFSPFSHLVCSLPPSLQGWSSSYPSLCFYSSHFHSIQCRNI